jgi:hypothetical protein
MIYPWFVFPIVHSGETAQFYWRMWW